MMKWLMYLVLALLCGLSWRVYSKTGGEIKTKTELADKLRDSGDPDGRLGKLEGEINSLDGQKTFNGILLVILSAALGGVFFVLEILPSFAHSVTHGMYGSGERVEHDAMRDARACLAQGDYEGAITAFQKAAAADPMNRMPWVEIAKIQKDHLEDLPAAIETIRNALEGQDWAIDDAAFFMFRLAELYDQDAGEHAMAVAIMQQVTELFPETRHAANARHKLHEWSAAGGNGRA